MRSNPNLPVCMAKGFYITLKHIFFQVNFMYIHSVHIYLCFVFAFQVLTEVSTHAYKSAGNIVEDKMEQDISDDDFNLTKPANLIRTTNRLREKTRPAEPKDFARRPDQQNQQTSREDQTSRTNRSDV